MAPRAVTSALVRDRYEGRAMAQVMSFVMTVFILIPMIAPSLGQAILQFAGWRSIFVFLIMMALSGLVFVGIEFEKMADPAQQFRIIRKMKAVSLKEI